MIRFRIEHVGDEDLADVTPQARQHRLFLPRFP